VKTCEKHSSLFFKKKIVTLTQDSLAASYLIFLYFARPWRWKDFENKLECISPANFFGFVCSSLSVWEDYFGVEHHTIVLSVYHKNIRLKHEILYVEKHSSLSKNCNINQRFACSILSNIPLLSKNLEIETF
jgi:hypothetical protein